jgi:hypothetical protein
MTARKLTRVVLALTLVAALVPLAVGGLAEARVALICRGASVLSYTDNDFPTYDTISITGGTGLCTGNLQGTYALTYSGSGHISRVGMCDADHPVTAGQTHPVTSDLVLAMNLHLVSTGDGHTLDLAEEWIGPVTTFPVITPFVALNDGGNGVAGAGYISTRIFIRCDPGGRPASTVFRISITPE